MPPKSASNPAQPRRSRRNAAPAVDNTDSQLDPLSSRLQATIAAPKAVQGSGNRGRGRGRGRGNSRGKGAGGRDNGCESQGDAERQEDSDSDSNVIFESITESSETEKLRGKRRSTARGKKPQEAFQNDAESQEDQEYQDVEEQDIEEEYQADDISKVLSKPLTATKGRRKGRGKAFAEESQGKTIPEVASVLPKKSRGGRKAALKDNDAERALRELVATRFEARKLVSRVLGAEMPERGGISIERAEEIEEFFKVGSNPLPITDEQKADEKRFREEAVAEMEEALVLIQQEEGVSSALKGQLDRDQMDRHMEFFEPERNEEEEEEDQAEENEIGDSDDGNGDHDRDDY